MSQLAYKYDGHTYEGLTNYTHSSLITLLGLDGGRPETYGLGVAMIDGEPELWVVDTLHHSDPAAAIKKVYRDREEFPHQITIFKTLSNVMLRCNPLSPYSD